MSSCYKLPVLGYLISITFFWPTSLYYHLFLASVCLCTYLYHYPRLSIRAAGLQGRGVVGRSRTEYLGLVCRCEGRRGPRIRFMRAISRSSKRGWRRTEEGSGEARLRSARLSGLEEKGFGNVNWTAMSLIEAMNVRHVSIWRMGWFGCPKERCCYYGPNICVCCRR